MNNYEESKLQHETQPQKTEELPTYVDQNNSQQELIADLEKRKTIQEESDAEALKKIREELDIQKPEETMNSADEEINEGLNMVSVNLGEFESDFRRNKFRPISFNSAGLKKINIDGNFNPKAASGEIQKITQAFKKNFLSDDPEERMSIGTHNFNNVIDSIDKLVTIFSNFRKAIEKKAKTPEDEADYKALDKSISDSITAMKVKNKGLEEANLALRQYRGR